jgi:hypothetical protein
MVLREFLFRIRVRRPYVAKKRCEVIRERNMEAWANVETGEDPPLAGVESERATVGSMEASDR